MKAGVILQKLIGILLLLVTLYVCLDRWTLYPLVTLPISLLLIHLKVEIIPDIFNEEDWD